MVIPLFKSHYSLGRSILTLKSAGKSTESEPDSIIDLALQYGLKQVTLVEDGFSSFLEAYTNCQESKLQLVFGLRLSVCQDVEVKSEEALSTTSKYIIFVRNAEGYKRLVKIFTFAASPEVMYYEPRIDFKNLKKFWSENDLQLAVPFYDSFLFKNTLRFSVCVPDFSFASPIFFIEHNNLLFDNLLATKVIEFCASNELQGMHAKSIYYARKKDFLAYLTFRCINNRSTLEKPEFEHLNSPTFNLESWKEQNDFFHENKI